ncbi:MAG: hypothetical protein PHO10_04325 [Gemmiger sp.]|nr:hypothetical protein [Gemmiger sp.]
MNYKRSYGILQGAFIAGGALGCLSMPTDSLLLAGSGLLILAGGLLQALLFYRCPRCNRVLNTRMRKPAFCPSCGQKLDL